MEKFVFFLMRWKLNILSIFAPKLAAKQAVDIFSKVRIKTVKEKEEWIYNNSTHFRCKTDFEDLNCFELGNPNGKLIFLVHGWESNAGSLSNFAKSLKANYRIITFDLPAHGRNKENATNMYVCKEAFKQLIRYVNPISSFDVVGHSFGSSVASIALSELNDVKADGVVLLSVNNHIEEVFKDFKVMIGFNDKVYQELLKIVHEVFNEKIDNIVIEKHLKNANFNELLLIHDTKDKIISFSNSVAINKAIPNSTLVDFTKIGHYRMLWNEDVLNTTLDFLNKSKK